MKSLYKTVAFITFFAVLTRFVGFLFRIYLSRALGAEALGLYTVSFSVFMVLVTFVTSGLPVVLSKLTAKYSTNNDKASEKQLVSTSLIISVITAAVLCLIVLAFNGLLSSLLPDSRSITILIALLPAVLFSAVYSVFRGAMWGHNNYFGVCATELFEQIIRFGVCALLIGFNMFNLSTSVSAALSLSIASGLAAVLVVLIFFLFGGRMGKPTKVYREVIKSSAPITAVRVLTSLVQPIIAIIIPLRLIAAGYTKSQAMSVYGVAIGMTMPLLFIPITLVGSLSMALVPDIASAIEKKDNKHVANRISSSVVFSMLITFIMIPLYIGAGENIGLFFFNNLQSGQLLSSAAWLMFPLALTNITSAILNALGLEAKSFINYLIGSVLLFVCIIFLPALIGIRALILGMGLCVAITSYLNLRMIKKKTAMKLHIIKPLSYMCLFSVPTAAIAFFITNLLNGLIPLFFNLAISCSVGAIFFILLCMIFNIVNINTMFVEFKSKFKNKIKIQKTKRT